MCRPLVPLARSFYHQCLIWSADGYYFQPISFQPSNSTTRETISPPVTRVGAWSSSNETNRSVGNYLITLDPLYDYYSALTLRSASPMALLCLGLPCLLPCWSISVNLTHTALQTPQMTCTAPVSLEKELRIQVLYRIPIARARIRLPQIP